VPVTGGVRIDLAAGLWADLAVVAVAGLIALAVVARRRRRRVLAVRAVSQRAHTVPLPVVAAPTADVRMVALRPPAARR
jgi:hypothetical protein